MSRTRKQPYTKVRAVDTSCRNHGSCPRCASDRLHKHAVRTVETPEELAEEDGRYAAADAFFAIFGMTRVR